MFGGGSSGMDDILSSPSGDVFLKKATVTLIIIFFGTSLILAVRTAHRSTRSLLEDIPSRSALPMPGKSDDFDMPDMETEEAPAADPVQVPAE